MGNTVEQPRFGHHNQAWDKYVRLPLQVWLDGTLGTRGGTSSDGVLVGKFTRQAVDYAFLDDGGVFTDDTTDINDADASDVALMPATEAVNDAFYFGSDHKFVAIELDMGTAGVGDTVVFEYYTAGGWVNLATDHKLEDSSTGLTAGTSNYFITWQIPDNWIKTTVNSVSAYWVRIRVTAASFGTVPLATQAWLYNVNAGVGISVPFAGYLEAVGWAAVTVSGTNADSVFNVINVTRGAVTSFTMTEGLKAGRVEVADKIYFNRGDDLVIQMVDEDGTTEYANVQLFLEFAA